MAAIRIICVGKIKERFYAEAVNEYLKRLNRYAKVSVIELADEKAPERASEAEKAAILKKEGGRILAALSDRDYVLALAIDGRSFSSEALAAHLDGLMAGGKSCLAFVIGGSLGLAPEVILRADERLSFSALTFPHQLMRVILLEQIYRCFRIARNEPYHK